MSSNCRHCITLCHSLYDKLISSHHTLGEEAIPINIITSKRAKNPAITSREMDATINWILQARFLLAGPFYFLPGITLYFIFVLFYSSLMFTQLDGFLRRKNGSKVVVVMGT